MVKEWKFMNELISDGDEVRKECRKGKIFLVRQNSEYVKINFDVSVKGDKVIIRYFIRDYMEKLIKAGVINLGKISVVMAEAILLKNGVK